MELTAAPMAIHLIHYRGVRRLMDKVLAGLGSPEEGLLIRSLGSMLSDLQRPDGQRQRIGCMTCEESELTCPADMTIAVVGIPADPAANQRHAAMVGGLCQRCSVFSAEMTTVRVMDVIREVWPDIRVDSIRQPGG